MSSGTQAYFLRCEVAGCGVVAPGSGVHQDAEDG